jgi:uncharacterized integral membrane protein
MNFDFRPLVEHVPLVFAFIGGALVGMLAGASITLAALRARVHRLTRKQREEA